LVRHLRPYYEWLLDAASGGRGIPWAINGECVRIDPRLRRLVAPTAEPELWSWLRANVRPGDRILDVGSFLGVYAILLARWGGPQARVLAFEPTPSSVAALRRHVDINRAHRQVKVVPQALGERMGTLELHEHSDPYRNSIGVSDPVGRATSSRYVAVTTIDEICKQNQFRPTLLRMDVQGFERSILLGARETIAAGREHLRIVLEVHPQLWELQGYDEAAFDTTLEELGLRARPLRASIPKYEPDGHVELVYA
jgi:FkbM family methyltransferase